MTRANQRATRIDACVTGWWTEVDNSWTKIGFHTESLVFDGQWLELYRPTLSWDFGPPYRQGSVEEVTGWYRVPVRRVRRLVYDLCVDESGY